MANEVFVFPPEPLLDALEEIAADAGEDSLEDLGDELLPRLVDAGGPRVPFRRLLARRGHGRRLLGVPPGVARGPPPIDLDDPGGPCSPRPSYRALGARAARGRVAEACSRPAARVAGTVERSVIGRGAVVEAGAIVRESVVLPGAVVRAGATVERAILDERVEIGRGASVGEAGGEVALVGMRAKVEEDGGIPAGGPPPRRRGRLRTSTAAGWGSGESAGWRCRWRLDRSHIRRQRARDRAAAPASTASPPSRS